MTEKLPELTVLVITCNEAANIQRTLDSVSFAGHILVVDSLSTDETAQIVARYPQAEIHERAFTTFADQCNFGLSLVQTDWVLSIDADYSFPENAAAAIETVIRGGDNWHEAAFEYCIEGKPVHGGILPPRVVLFRAGSAHYEDDGHGHRLAISGTPRRLPFRIRHDDRKPLRRWLESQVRYADMEAEKLTSMPARKLGRNDRLRKLLFIAPPAVFLLVYVLRGGFLSGWRGLYYALQRCTAEMLLSLFLIQRALKGRGS